MDGITIKFDDNNSNLLLFYRGKQLINMLVVPPIDKGCDIFDVKFNTSRYKYNFDGLVVITSETERIVYHRGEIMCRKQR